MWPSAFSPLQCHQHLRALHETPGGQGPPHRPCSAPGETEPQVKPTTQAAGESTGFGLGFQAPLSALNLSPCPRRPLEFTWHCGAAGVGPDHVRTQASGLPDQQQQSTCWEHSPHPWGHRHPPCGGRPHSVCPTATTAQSTRPPDSLGGGPSAPTRRVCPSLPTGDLPSSCSGGLSLRRRCSREWGLAVLSPRLSREAASASPVPTAHPDQAAPPDSCIYQE